MPKPRRKRLTKKDRAAGATRLTKGGILLSAPEEKVLAHVRLRNRETGLIEAVIPVFALDDKHVMARLNNHGRIDSHRFEVDMTDVARAKDRLAEEARVRAMKVRDDYF